MLFFVLLQQRECMEKVRESKQTSLHVSTTIGGKAAEGGGAALPAAPLSTVQALSLASGTASTGSPFSRASGPTSKRIALLRCQQKCGRVWHS